MASPAAAAATSKVDASGALTAEWKDKVDRTIALVEKSNSAEESSALFALLARVLTSALARPEHEGLRRLHVDSATFQQAIGNVKVSLALLYTIGYARKQVKDKPAMVLAAPDPTAPSGAGDLLYLQYCIAALNAAAARIQHSIASAVLGVPLVAAPAAPAAHPSPMAMAGGHAPEPAPRGAPAAKASPVPVPVPAAGAGAAGAHGAAVMVDDRDAANERLDAKSDAKSDRKSPVFGPADGGAHFNPSAFAVPASAAASGNGGGAAGSAGGGPGSPFAGMAAGEAAELRAAMARFEAEERAQREAKRRADEAADAEMARKLAAEMQAGDAAARAAARAAEAAASEKFLKEMQRRDEQDALARKDAALVQALEADNQLKRYLREQLKKGVRIEIDQFNTLNLGDGLKPDAKFDCIVCFEKFALDKVLVLGCRHLLCLGCTKEYFTAEINGGKVENLKCSVPTCKHRVTAMEVAYACDKKTIAKYNDFLFDAALRKDPNARWCPHKGCGTPMLGSKEHPMLQCPKCRFRFCYNCQTDEWHAGSTCANYQKWKAENKSGDKKFEQFISKVCKRCPKCKVVTEKNEGCDHMSCRCGHQYYWSTLKKYP